jgi:hypothetical protein
MKVGNMVRFKDKTAPHNIGTLLSYGTFSKGWWDILTPSGVVAWPETQLEVIDESC